MSLIHGLLLGLGTAFILGPVFFTLLRNSLQLGSKAGVAAASGILLSDLAVLAICYFIGAASLKKWLDYPWAQWIAALVFLLFGLQFLLKKIMNFDDTAALKANDLWTAFSQGFIINFVNPVVFVIWLGFIGIGQQQHPSALPLFFAGILIGIYATDLCKALFAPRIRHWLKQRYLHFIYRGIGVLLIAFAIRIVVLEIIK